MATIAISAAITVGVGLLQYAFSPKPKLPRVDRGRADDIRIMTSDEGTYIPRFKGWGRAAPNIIWNTEIIEHAQRSTVEGSGKGFGGGSAQEQVDFTYTVTLCCAICAGPVWNGLRRIWRDTEVIFNTSGDNGGYYDAEESDNTLTGSTQIVTYDNASGRKEVTLQGNSVPDAAVQFNDVLSYGAATRALTIYYRTGAVTSYKLYVNGVLVETNTFPNTGNTTFQTRTIDVVLLDGLNTIKIENTDPVFNLGIDRIFVFPGFDDGTQATGVVSTEDFPIIAPDPDNPLPFFDAVPIIETGDGGTGFSGGAGSGTLSDQGGTQFFFYLGTEDQPQDATMVSADGVDQVPAYRGVFYCLIKDLQLKDNRMPNLTFEFDEGTHDLAKAITDYYKEVGASEDELDMSQLEGIHFIGQVVDSLRPLSETLEPLQQWYNFDLLPIDSKIVAVLRGGASVETITEDQLAAYEEGAQPPDGVISIDYVDPLAIPREVNIGFLNVAKDYKNGTEPAARAVGLNQNIATDNFPIVAEANEAVQVGLRILYNNYIERLIRFTTGMEFYHLAPTDPVTLALTGITHRVRIFSRQAPPGGGLVKWQGFTEDVGVYTQVLAPGNQGFESLLVDFPANSFLVIIDASLLRAEDAGDGTQPVIYLAVCKRGTVRPWRGGVVFHEQVPDEWERVTDFQVNATIGVARGTLGTHADVTTFDNVNGLTVDFWNDAQFESYSEIDLLAQPNINLFWIGVNGGQGEYAQARTVTPVAPLAGYQKAFTFSNWLRGRFQTAYEVPYHVADEVMVLMDSTIKPRTVPRIEVGTTSSYLAATIGQGINEAEAVSMLNFSLVGNSLRPAPVVDHTLLRISNDLITTWERGTGFVGADQLVERYIHRIYDVATSTLKRTHPIEAVDDIPLEWTYYAGAGNQAFINLDPDGTIECDTGKGDFLLYRSQAFVGDCDVIWSVDSRFMGTIVLYYTATLLTTGVRILNRVMFGVPAGQPPGEEYFIDADGGTSIISPLKRRLAPLTELMIKIRNGQATYFLDNQFWRRSTYPAITDSFLIEAGFFDDIYLPANQAMLKVRVRPALPRQFVYTEEMQETDYPGGVPATVISEVVEVSALGFESRPSRKTG